MQCSGICDTEKFCTEIGRCLAQTLYDGLGETDMKDMEELTADDVSIVLPRIESDVFEKPLSNQVIEILKYAIK